MRIAVIGSGALGLLWGARLADLTHELKLFTRTKTQRDQLNEQGILLTTRTNQKQQRKVKAEWIQSVADQRPFDLLFITVKQTHLPQVINTVQILSHPESQLIFWQNGLGHEEQIKLLRDRIWTYAAVTTEGAWKKNGYEVKHTGHGETKIGLFPATDKQPHALFSSFLLELSAKWDLSIQYDDQIQKRLWEKLAVNCVINPLTALYEIQNSKLLSEKYQGLIEQILQEFIAVVDKMGMKFTLKEIMGKVKTVCMNTSNNYSSMLQDLRKGAPTEIDFINGAIVKAGNQLGIGTPFNQQLIQLIHQKEAEIIHNEKQP